MTHTNNNLHSNELGNHNNYNTISHRSNNHPSATKDNNVAHSISSQPHHHQLQPEYHSDEYHRAITQLTSVTIQHTGRGRGGLGRGSRKPPPPNYTDSHTYTQNPHISANHSSQYSDDEDDISNNSSVLQTQETEITNVSTNQLAHPDTITTTVIPNPSNHHPPLITSKFTSEQAQRLMINFNNYNDLQQCFHRSS